MILTLLITMGFLIWIIYVLGEELIKAGRDQIEARKTYDLQIEEILKYERTLERSSRCINSMLTWYCPECMGEKALDLAKQDMKDTGRTSVIAYCSDMMAEIDDALGYYVFTPDKDKIK